MGTCSRESVAEVPCLKGDGNRSLLAPLERVRLGGRGSTLALHLEDRSVLITYVGARGRRRAITDLRLLTETSGPTATRCCTHR
jgi:hypothetical protein